MTVFIPGPILQNTTITSSGSVNAYSGPGSHSASVIINIANAPTGTTPTITFTIQEVDVSNFATPIGTAALSTVSINAAGVYPLSYITSYNGAVIISWSVSGTTPSFTGVSVSLSESSGIDIGPLRDRNTTQTISALGGIVQVSSEGAGVVGVQITGTWVGTINFEGSMDGNTWFNLGSFPPQAAPLVVSTTANGVWKVNASGIFRVRCRASAWTSGTASITYNVGAGSTFVAAVQGTPAALIDAWSVKVTDGANVLSTMDVAARAGYQKITDGTNTLPTMDVAARAGFQKVTDGTNTAVVKAASTAPAAADPAVVVAVSPNTPVLPVILEKPGAAISVSFGRVLVGTTGALTALRATAYTEQTANFTGSVKSSSVNDTAAGTGARTVIITYYDQTGAGPKTEAVILNGLTGVNLVNTDHCFIESMKVVTAGTGGTNAGTITLTTGTLGTGTTVGTIAVGTIVAAVGDGITLWGHHYVATGKTASSYSLGGGTTGNQIGILFLKSIQPLVANSVENPLSDALTIPSGGGYSSRVLSPINPIKVSGFARITAYVIANGNNVTFFGAFDYSEA